MLFKKYYMVLIENQTKYGLIKVANFTLGLLKKGWKIIILKCIQHITKENLLLLKDLSEL